MKKYDYELAGVTGSARDGSDIQQALKAFFEDDLESAGYSRTHDVKFEEFDDQGSKAYAVLVDGTEIGCVASEDLSDFAEFAGKAASCTVKFGVNGHDIEEFETIIDRYKDKKFWKEEDPDFDDKAVNKAYNDLMDGLKKGEVYQATLSFPSPESSGYEEAEEDLTDEEKKKQAEMDRFVKYFRILFPLSILLLFMGLLYLRISVIMGGLNLFFGALGVYFSRKYTKQYREQKKKEGRS